MTLTKLMFGSEFSNKSRMFGLSCGQMRGGYGDGDNDQWCHNAGWYNKAGEKLGWGDLSPGDFRRILAEIQEGDAFIILSESDSFWNFVNVARPTFGWDQGVSPTEQAPGLNYVVEKACYCIVKSGVFWLSDYCAPKDRVEKIQAGIKLTYLTKKELRAKIMALPQG